MQFPSNPARPSPVLLTGATGYVGGRLLKALEQRRVPVRCLARRPEFLKSQVASTTEVIKGDCLDRPSLAEVMSGVDCAYYLVHSMGSPGKFEEQDRQAAVNFADAARESGTRRIIYLGGLGRRIPPCRLTCAVDRKLPTSFELRAFRSSSFELPS